MQAALGRTQLKKVPAIKEKRTQNFKALKQGLGGIDGLSVLDAPNERALNSHYCLVALLSGDLANRRDELVLTLNQEGVGTSIYYPHPVPRLSYYRNQYGYEEGRFPGAEAVSDNSITLPVGPHLDTSDMNDIAEALKTAIG